MNISKSLIRSSFIFFMCIVSSCNKPNEEKTFIKGAWQLIGAEADLNYGTGCVGFEVSEKPFIIHIGDSTIENEMGFMDSENPDHFLEYKRIYKKEGNLLEVYNSYSKSWYPIEVVFSTADSLVLQDTLYGKSYYRNYIQQPINKYDITKVIVCVYDDQVQCPDYNLTLDLFNESYLVFEGDTIKGFLDTALKKYIFDKIKKSNLEHFETKYQNEISDSHARKVLYTFLCSQDTLKSISMTSHFGPTILKKILMPLDDYARQYDTIAIY